MRITELGLITLALIIAALLLASIDYARFAGVPT